MYGAKTMSTLAFSFSMVFAVFPLVGDKARACGSISTAAGASEMPLRSPFSR